MTMWEIEIHIGGAIMANQKFCGAVASQAYRWGYTCEFCKRPVEKTAHVSTQVGSMHKSTTWVSTTTAGAKAMEDQARMQLVGPVAQLQAKIDAGSFTPPEGEDGKCPHCKKYQHWSSAIQSQIASYSNAKKARGDNIALGCCTFFFGMWPGIGLMVLSDKLFHPDKAIRLYVMIAALAVGFALTWFVVRKIYRKSEAKLDAQVKELEGLEKNDPRFIAWGELTSGTRGMSVH